jgi:hypothetical protein
MVYKILCDEYGIALLCRSERKIHLSILLDENLVEGWFGGVLYILLFISHVPSCAS